MLLFSYKLFSGVFTGTEKRYSSPDLYRELAHASVFVLQARGTNFDVAAEVLFDVEYSADGSQFTATTTGKSLGLMAVGATTFGHFATTSAPGPGCYARIAAYLNTTQINGMVEIWATGRGKEARRSSMISMAGTSGIMRPSSGIMMPRQGIITGGTPNGIKANNIARSMAVSRSMMSAGTGVIGRSARKGAMGTMPNLAARSGFGLGKGTIPNIAGRIARNGTPGIQGKKDCGGDCGCHGCGDKRPSLPSEIAAQSFPAARFDRFMTPQFAPPQRHKVPLGGKDFSPAPMLGPPPRARGQVVGPLVGDCVEWVPFSRELIDAVNSAIGRAWDASDAERVDTIRPFLDGTIEDCGGTLMTRLATLKGVFETIVGVNILSEPSLRDELSRACARATLGSPPLGDPFIMTPPPCGESEMLAFLDNLLQVNRDCRLLPSPGVTSYDCPPGRPDCVCGPVLTYTCHGVTLRADIFNVVSPWFLMPDGYWAFSRVACRASVDHIVLETSVPLRLSIERECALRGECVTPQPLSGEELFALALVQDATNGSFWRMHSGGLTRRESLDWLWLVAFVRNARAFGGAVFGDLTDEELMYLGTLTDGPTSNPAVCDAKGIVGVCYTYARGSTNVFSVGTPPVIYRCGPCR